MKSKPVTDGSYDRNLWEVQVNRHETSFLLPSLIHSAKCLRSAYKSCQLSSPIPLVYVPAISTLTLTSQNPLLSSNPLYGFPLPPLPCVSPSILPLLDSSALGSQPSLSILPAHSFHRIGLNGAMCITSAYKRMKVETIVSSLMSSGSGRGTCVGDGRSACSYAE